MDVLFHKHPKIFDPNATRVTPADLLTPEETGKLLGVSVKTLATWRSTGRHALPYIRCGARIRYQRHALTEWLQQRTQACTTPAAKGQA